jgi:hypothetical protein
VISRRVIARCGVFRERKSLPKRDGAQGALLRFINSRTCPSILFFTRSFTALIVPVDLPVTTLRPRTEVVGLIDHSHSPWLIFSM